MPRVKREEKEEAVDTIKVQKKESAAVRWFNDTAVNNASDLRRVCELVAKSAKDQFNLRLKSENYEVYGVIFYGAFVSILKYIKSMEKKYKNFTILICNSVNIGYTNNTDENNEKIGNFMPLMEYIGTNRNIVDFDINQRIQDIETDKGLSDQDKRDLLQRVESEVYIKWKNLNTKKQSEAFKSIQEDAFNLLLNEYGVHLRTSEAVIPLFCMFMDTLSNVLKFKFQEAKGTKVSEVSMSVFGLFDMYYSYDEDDDREVIEFAPDIFMKLYLKNDEIADTKK